MMRPQICVVLTVVLCGILTAESKHGRKHSLGNRLGPGRVGKHRPESPIPKNQTFALNNGSDTVSGTDSHHDKPSQTDSYYSSAALDLDGTLQDQPNYNTVSEYEAELRRRQELRRRHEEERQRRLEERRRLENERRRLEDQRRQQEEDRRRQTNEQGRVHEQQPQVTDGYQYSRQDLTANQHSGSTRRQQQLQLPSSTTSSQRRGASQEPTSHDAQSRTGVSHQQGQRPVPTRQQSHGNSNSSDSSQTNQYSHYRPPVGPQFIHRTNPSYPQGSDNIHNQQQGTHQQGTYFVSNQRPASTQQYSNNPSQTDQRSPLTSQRGVYPGFSTRYVYGGQGQNQWYPSQDTAGYVGSYYPFDEQNAYSNCPDTGVELRINGLSCQQAVQQFGNSLCYSHEYTSRQCCEVCRPVKQPARIGCEYGDHAPQCSSINPGDCYDLRNRQICCETCQKLRRNDTPPGCEYGDMTSRCDTVRQNPGLCYRPDNQRICCQTCSQTRNASNPGCPWGDYDHSLCQMFDDHTNNVRLNCYSQHRRRLCCQSCERLREWIPDNLPDDCQYGDRPVTFSTSHFGRLNCSNILNHFSTDECRVNPAVYINCCYTCHRYRTSQG